MATFEKLPADQRAIVELVLQRGQSYAELSERLGMPEARVRELARDALVQLAPVTAGRVDEEWQGQLADYVLGQQSGPESTATRGHLRRSEAARSWARSLLDSLDTLYADDLPSIPDGERGGRGKAKAKPAAAAAAAPAAAKTKETQRRPLAGATSDAVKRRRLITAGGVLALILVGLLLWPVGLLTGGDDEGGSEQAASGNRQAAAGGKPAGIAVIAQQDGKRQVVVQAANLAPSQQRRAQAYEVWLYNSPQDAKSLGAQVTDQRGQYQGAGPLPSDYRRYKFVDVSQEPIDRNPAHSGQSVLRGQVGRLRSAPADTKKGQPAILGQVVLAPPQG